MNKLVTEGATILMAVVGLAIVAVLVSNRANTSSVIGSAGDAFSKILGAATAPVSGGGFSFGNFSSF